MKTAGRTTISLLLSLLIFASCTHSYNAIAKLYGLPAMAEDPKWPKMPEEKFFVSTWPARYSILEAIQTTEAPRPYIIGSDLTLASKTIAQTFDMYYEVIEYYRQYQSVCITKKRSLSDIQKQHEKLLAATKANGSNTDYASTINNLAYQILDCSPGLAIQYLKTAIEQINPSKNSVEYATISANLASVYLRAGEKEKFHNLLKESISSLRSHKKFREANIVLGEKGYAELIHGDNQGAIDTFEAIRKTSSTSDSIADVASATSGIALARWRLGEQKEAERELLHALRLRERHMMSLFRLTSYARSIQLRFILSELKTTSHIWSLSTDRNFVWTGLRTNFIARDLAKYADRTIQTSLRREIRNELIAILNRLAVVKRALSSIGLLYLLEDEILDIHFLREHAEYEEESLRSGKKMDTLELVNRLQSAIHNNNKYERKELDTYIQHYEKELGKASNLVHNRSATLGGARSEVIELEEKIIHFISGIEVNFPNSYNDFVDKMNKDDVFIYFYNYDTSAPGLEEHSIYGAAVFRPERPLVVKKLDGAKRIDLHIVAVAQLLLNAERLVEDRQTLNERLRDLDKLVLTALDAEIKGAKRVYISATGRLSSIPFAAYIGPGMRHRIHDFEFVSSGPLDAFSHDPLPPRSGSAIISIPDYDRVPEGTGARWPLRSRPIYSQWKNGPGIKDEFVRINRLFHTKYTGVQASRPALLQVSAPAVLHISAHGDVACVSGDDIIAIAVGASQAGTQRGVKVVQVPGEHGVGHCKEAGAGLAEPAAMIALAGANRSTMAGYVDVEELRTLDLVGTELAVLAACGTGVVQMTDDEALASAMSDSLVQAGANSVVSTKWLVDDVASGKLVSKYYSLLAKGKDRATALRQAQLALMKDPAYSHPYYWAGFIHWGQAGPLLPGSLQVR